MNRCERCGLPSVYHSTLVVNGVSKTTSLCRECAIKEGVFNSSPTSMFEDMFSSFANALGFEQVENLVCPVCKTSLKEFKTSGKLGCPNCYDTFRQEVSNVIKKIAPFDSHKQEVSSVKTTKTKQTKEQKISDLRSKMAEAVKEERYEDAAKLKKQIAKLEAENE